MVSGVSGMSNNIAFKANAMDKVTPEMMNQPSAFAQNPIAPAEQQAAPKKKGSILGTIAKTILKLAVVAGVAIAARKYVPGLKNVDPTVALAEDAKFMDKAKHYFAKYTDIVEKGSIGKLSAYFKKNPIEGKAVRDEAAKMDKNA